MTTSPELTPTVRRAPVNLRDVRGLRTEDGRIVRRAVLYRSEVPLAGARRRGRRVPEPHNRALLGVQASTLEAVLDEVEGGPGGASGWLAERGVAPDRLELLRRRLLSPVRAPRSH